MNVTITRKSHELGIDQLRKEFGLDLQAAPQPEQRTRCYSRGCRGFLKQCANPKRHLSEALRKDWKHQVSECERCGSHTHFTPAAVVGKGGR